MRVKKLSGRISWKVLPGACLQTGQLRGKSRLAHHRPHNNERRRASDSGPERARVGQSAVRNFLGRPACSSQRSDQARVWRLRDLTD